MQVKYLQHFYRSVFVGSLLKYKRTYSEPEDGRSKFPRTAMPRDEVATHHCSTGIQSLEIDI